MGWDWKKIGIGAGLGALAVGTGGLGLGAVAAGAGAGALAGGVWDDVTGKTATREATRAAVSATEEARAYQEKQYETGMGSLTRGFDAAEAAMAGVPQNIANLYREAEGAVTGYGEKGLAELAAGQTSALGAIDAVDVGSIYDPITASLTAIPSAEKDIQYARGLLTGESELEKSAAYKFRRAEGIAAGEAEAGAAGMLLSGNTLRGLEEFSQGLASQEFGAEFGRRAGLAELTSGREMAAKGMLTDLASKRGNLEAGLASSRASIFEGTAARKANVYSEMGSMIAGLKTSKAGMDTAVAGDIAKLKSARGSAEASLAIGQGQDIGAMLQSLGQIKAAGRMGEYTSQMGFATGMADIGLGIADIATR